MSEVKVSQSGPTLLRCGLYSPWDSPGQNTGVDSHSLLQGIFPTQESNPGLPQADSLPSEPPGKPKNTGVGSLSLLQGIFLSTPLSHMIIHSLNDPERASQVVVVVRNPPTNAGDILRDMGSIPGSGRSSGGGHDTPLQYSFLENPHGQRNLAGYSLEVT